MIIYKKFLRNLENNKDQKYFHFDNYSFSYEEIDLNIKKLENNLAKIKYPLSGMLVFVASKNSDVVISSLVLASKLGFCICILENESSREHYSNFKPNIVINSYEDIEILSTDVHNDLAGKFLLLHTSGSINNPKPVIFDEEEKIARVTLSQRLFDIKINDNILCYGNLSYSLHVRAALISIYLNTVLINLAAEVSSEIPFKKLILFTNPRKLKQILEVGSNVDRSKWKVVCTSSKASKSLKNLLSKENLTFYDCYGSTEISYATVSKGFEDNVGAAIDEAKIKINNPDGNNIGEIYVESEFSTKNYFRRPFLSKLHYDKNFFKTGDYGYLDEEGNLHLTQKRADLIKTSSTTVYSLDIESMIKKIKEISDVFIANRISSEDGDETEVYIEMHETRKKDQVEIKVRTILETLDVDAKIYFLNHLPRNELGKINYRLLKGLFEKK